jgi:hypothetical protein
MTERKIADGPCFNLGKVVITPGAEALLKKLDKNGDEFVHRHVRGDWGDLCDEDWKHNDDAMLGGDRLLSSYGEGDDKLWIITEWDRSVTTLLTPEEY